MTSDLNPRSLRPAARLSWQCAVILIVFLVPALIAFGVTGLFRLSSDTAALRDSVAASIDCEKQLALNVGWGTAGMARAALSFCELPLEAQMALRAFKSADVALYRLRSMPDESDQKQLIARMDAEMKARRLERCVLVHSQGNTVAVYVPMGRVGPEKFQCNVLVLHENEAVIVGFRGNLQPVVDFVSDQVRTHGGIDQLAIR